jgi:Uma2 family endonuclease
MSVLAPEATLADWIDALRDQHVELVDGQLVPQEKGMLSLWIASRISQLIGNHVYDRSLGFVATEVPIQVAPGRGRKPDVVYYKRESLPQGIPTTLPMPRMPDLLVEVLSPSNDLAGFEDKLNDYFTAGSPVVWLVNPFLKSVRVYLPDQSSIYYDATKTLAADPVIPGFSVRVIDLFQPATV